MMDHKQIAYKMLLKALNSWFETGEIEIPEPEEIADVATDEEIDRIMAEFPTVLEEAISFVYQKIDRI